MLFYLIFSPLRGFPFNRAFRSAGSFRIVPIGLTFFLPAFSARSVFTFRPIANRDTVFTSCSRLTQSFVPSDWFFIFTILLCATKQQSRKRRRRLCPLAAFLSTSLLLFFETINSTTHSPLLLFGLGFATDFYWSVPRAHQTTGADVDKKLQINVFRLNLKRKPCFVFVENSTGNLGFLNLFFRLLIPTKTGTTATVKYLCIRFFKFK